MGSHAELIKVRFPSYNGPCIFQQFDNGGIERARELIQDAGSAGGREIAGADIVFDRNQSAINIRFGCVCESISIANDSNNRSPVIDLLTLLSPQVRVLYTVQPLSRVLQGSNECIEGGMKFLVSEAFLGFAQEEHLGRQSEVEEEAPKTMSTAKSAVARAPGWITCAVQSNEQVTI